MTAFDSQPPESDESTPSPEAEPRPIDAGPIGGEPAAPPPPPGPYAARAASYYRNVRYVITAAMIAMGCWFLYDGFVKYPAENREYARLQAEIEEANDLGDSAEAAQLLEQQKGLSEHSDLDLAIQKILGFTLPPLALLLLWRWLYISRGEVRLDADDTLHVPGHPPVPASAIEEIDDSLWDRKGIAHVYYTDNGTEGRVKLDDFVYDRKPVDQIHDRLVYLKSGVAHDSTHDSHDAATDEPTA